MRISIFELRKFIQNVLVESRENIIQELVDSCYGEISHDSFRELFKLTSHVPTLKRIIKMIRWKAEDDAGEGLKDLNSYVPILIDLLKKFFELKKTNAIEEKDLGKYTWETLEDAIARAEEKKNLTRRSKKNLGGDRLYEDSDFVVVRINDFDACQIYGRGTRWCVTSKKDNAGYWREHTVDYGQKLYFILSKNPTYSDFDKVAVVFWPGPPIPFSGKGRRANPELHDVHNNLRNYDDLNEKQKELVDLIVRTHFGTQREA